jgi:hypothetical protein
MKNVLNQVRPYQVCGAEKLLIRAIVAEKATATSTWVASSSGPTKFAVLGAKLAEKEEGFNCTRLLLP